MENVPISYRLSKTMDVLMKFEKVPLGLKATAQEAISNLIIRALWKNQLHSEASPSSGQHYIFNKKKIYITEMVRYFISKIVLTFCEKNYFSDREKLEQFFTQ